MPKSIERFFVTLGSILLASVVFAQSAYLAQAQNRPGSKQEASLRSFLQKFVSDSAEDKTTQFSYAVADLKDDGTYEVVVYLMGNGWCGSGGCTTLILAPNGDSYNLVTKIGIARLPIRVLSTKTNGWHDLAVGVQGGGIVRGYEAKLSFNGKTYPHNPSIPPAERLEKKVGGKVILPTSALTDGRTPLY